MADITQDAPKNYKTGGLYLVLALAIALVAASPACQKPVADTPSDGSVKDVLHLEPFVVNLADPEGDRFLRIGVDLGLASAPAPKEGRTSAGDVPTARIRDCILSITSAWRSDDLLAPDGKRKLKNQLLCALHERVPDLAIREIYFTDFLVQR